jgi:hypothetical protein
MRRLLFAPLLTVLVLGGSGFREPLTWPAPPMGPGARVIEVPTAGGEWGTLPPNVDCEVRMPRVPVTSRVKVVGCRNIRVVGGELRSQADPCSPAAHGTDSWAGVYFQDFAGIAHVEGLRIHGRGFSDGIWLASDKLGSVGQVEGNWIGGLAACSEPRSFQETWPYEHPDCFQTWNGPLALRFDKNTCWTPYQGFYLDTAALPGPAGAITPARTLDIRRTNVHLDERSPNGRGCFMVWSALSTLPTNLERVHCDQGARDFAGSFAPRLTVSRAWAEALPGTPARGDEVRPSEAGIGYRRVSGARPAWLEAPAVRRLVSGRGRVLGLRRTLRRGLVLRVRCLDACRIRASVTAGRRGAPRQVARGRGRLARAGVRTVPVRFGAAARRRLHGARRVRLTVRVAIAARDARGVVERPLTLRRR